jgi:hypothetical protein
MLMMSRRMQASVLLVFNLAMLTRICRLVFGVSKSGPPGCPELGWTSFGDVNGIFLAVFGGILVMLPPGRTPECGTDDCDALRSYPAGPYQDMAAYLLYAVSYVATPWLPYIFTLCSLIDLEGPNVPLDTRWLHPVFHEKRAADVMTHVVDGGGRKKGLVDRLIEIKLSIGVLLRFEQECFRLSVHRSPARGPIDFGGLALP